MKGQAVKKVIDHLPTVGRIVGDDTAYQATVLALVHVESAGDESAVSKSGSFHGLLQIGVPYMKDACAQNKMPYVHPRVLVGDAAQSVWVFRLYMERYAKWHEWRPDYMALAHKAGAGSLKSVATGEVDIDDFKKWNTDEYLRRFRAAYPIYLAEAVKNGGVC